MSKTTLNLLEMAIGSTRAFDGFIVRRKGQDSFELSFKGKRTVCDAVVASEVIDGQFELEAVTGGVSMAEIRRKTFHIRSLRHSGMAVAG